MEGFKGSVGLIRSVTRPFCSGCRRLRLTSEGKLRACLVEGGEVDVNAFLSGENDDPAALAKVFSGCAGMKPERHSGSFTGVMTPGKGPVTGYQYTGGIAVIQRGKPLHNYPACI
ncbi:MAG: hypothetical protein ACOCVB_01405 [Bacillota bacterium]